MARAEISSGICGFTTTVTARPGGDGQHVALTIESDCPNVQHLVGNDDPLGENINPCYLEPPIGQ